MIEAIRQLLDSNLYPNPELQARLISTMIVLVALWLLRLLLRRLIYRQFRKDARGLYNWRKLVEYFIVILGVFLVGRIWLEGIQSLATYLGLLSAGLAIALQDLVINLAGWAFIIWRRPFRVGDRVQVGDYAGDVIDIRIFEFSMLEIGNWVHADQSTGRIIHVPNGKIFTEVFANYSQGLPYIWNEIPVLITFESNWEKAKAILTQIINQHAPKVSQEAQEFTQRLSRRFVISYTNMAPAVYTKKAESGVLLTIRYMIEPRQRRNSEQAVWEAVLSAFRQHWDIDFAYETQREYHYWKEGKHPPGVEFPAGGLAVEEDDD